MTSDDILASPPEASYAPRRPQTDRIVFGVTGTLTLAFVLWGAISKESLSDVSSRMLNGVMHNAGWAFVVAASGFVIFSLWLAFSRYGKITLGREGESPEFRTVSWVAMMFSAGMGIGLMFYGVSEPLSHYAEPPPGTSPKTPAARMETSMATTLFHWTLHPWAIYAVVGLAIAYSCFRRGRRQTVSAVFTPLIGERHVNGLLGKCIDILAIIATLFGSAASLGLGALQISSGFQEVGWASKGVGVGLLLVIIGALTAAFVLSAVSGVERGIQWLSNINMVLAGLLALFIFVVGPTVLQLDLLPTTVGSYFGDLPQMVARTGASEGKNIVEWLGNWTVFYWAWWISWTPFVGMFIARISRGRTIRQFVGGVILVPSTVSLIWFAILGGTAMRLEENGVALSKEGTQEGQLFSVLNEYPLAGVTSILVMILVGIFFVSGADAASVVMGTLTQKGSLEPSRPVVIFWGALTGAVAGIMLVIGQIGTNGGEENTALEGLQTLTILAAVPFALVMVALCVALMRDLRRDALILRGERGEEAVEMAVIAGHEQYAGDFEIRIGPGNGNGHGTVTVDGPSPQDPEGASLPAPEGPPGSEESESPEPSSGPADSGTDPGGGDSGGTDSGSGDGSDGPARS